MTELTPAASEPSAVLIVDDRAENILTLEAVLASPERRLFKASCGNDALAATLEHDFAVVLLDVQMPGMDGFELAELLRGSPRTRHIPIIFVTAISKEQRYVFRGYEAGAVDYLPKPIEPEVLKSKVRVFCELHRQRRLIEQQASAIERRNQQLARQLAEIKQLQGLLPICSHCKSIRGDDGYWQRLESYLSEHIDAQFSHGICPSCLEHLFPEVACDCDADDERAA
jgi:CheY-like chemotaxis protein